MAQFEDLTKSAAIGIGVGIGIGLAGALIGGGDHDKRRRFLKRVAHGYCELRDSLQRAAAETMEDLSDLLAEVESERSTEPAPAERANTAARSKRAVPRKPRAVPRAAD